MHQPKILLMSMTHFSYRLKLQKCIICLLWWDAECKNLIFWLFQKIRNYTVPSWAGQDIFDRMPVVTVQQYEFKSHTPELKRLRMGALLKLIIGNMKQSISNTQEPDSKEKMFMLSSHDTTITGILNTFGVYDFTLPPYAASLMIELHKDPKHTDYHIQVRR